MSTKATKQKKKTQAPASEKKAVQQDPVTMETFQQMVQKLRKEIRNSVVDYYQPDVLRSEKSEGEVVFADLNATTSGFQVVNWEINPANSALFPRLAPLAQMWSKWRVRSIVVEFIPAGGVFSTPGKQGNLIHLGS